MSNTTEFEFEAFQDNFNLSVDEPSDWPALAVEFVYTTHPAEPDVGIFGEQIEITETGYYVNDELFHSEAAFVTEIYELIGDEIEDSYEAVAKVVRDQIAEWEQEVGEE